MEHSILLSDKPKDFNQNAAQKDTLKKEYPSWVNEYTLLFISILSFGTLIFLLGVPPLVAMIVAALLLLLELWVYLKSKIALFNPKK